MARSFTKLWCGASVVCFVVLAVVVSAHEDDKQDSQVRQRRQAWLPRIGRRTTLVLPRTGRPEDQVFADSFENTLRQAIRDFAVEQRANSGDDCEPTVVSSFYKGNKKRADRNPPSVMMRLGKRSAPCKRSASNELQALEALKKYGIRLI